MAEAGSNWRYLVGAVLAVVLPLAGLLLLIFNGRAETPNRQVPTQTQDPAVFRTVDDGPLVHNLKRERP